MNATSEPSIMMDRPVLIPLPNFHLKASLPSDIAEFGTFRDTECYPSLALMVHSVFLLAWSHSEMESSSTHSVYSFESVETTVIVISCGRANSGLELISALDKALPMFDLRDTECYATEMEQLAPSGVMTNPYDQAVVFITAVVLLENVMARL